MFSGDLRTIDDYGRYSARLRAAMGPHIVDILHQGLSIALDSQQIQLAIELDAFIDHSGQRGPRPSST